MRKFVVGVAALLLSACGGEVYQMAPIEAYTTLTSVGTTNIDPLPGGLSPVNVSFEAVPGDDAVQWLFTHEGDELARFIAKVTPEGDSASKVALHYVEGSAPDDKWRNGQVKRLLQSHIQQLVIEAVDSRMESRPFNKDLRNQVVAQVTTSTMMATMDDVSASLDKEIARRKEASASRGSSVSPRSATRPTTDLSKY